MPSLRDHQSGQTTKMLLIGDPGAGKTGALCSLAKAGFNLRFADCDNGLDVVKNILLSPGNIYGAEAIDRVIFETLTDPMKNVNGKLLPKAATVWQRLVKLLDKWSPANGASHDLGPITTWGSQDVLVLDSLSRISDAAMQFILSMNGRLGQKPQLGDWYDAQILVEGLLQMLYDNGVKCNVIMLAHITYIGENGVERGYPNSLGKSFPPKIGSYFNTILMVKSSGSGNNTKRKILTNTSGIVELKNSSPTTVKPEYDQATGLAEYFKDVRSGALAPIKSTNSAGTAPQPESQSVSVPTDEAKA
jgi:hypothetical protein